MDHLLAALGRDSVAFDLGLLLLDSRNRVRSDLLGELANCVDRLFVRRGDGPGANLPCGDDPQWGYPSAFFDTMRVP